ncbi:MAG: VWA domain-containing protein [bacterium]|nr:VWA domain-containing protein [bacterium]
MLKRLMIGLVAVGLVAIFIAETANARTIRRRRSVEVSHQSYNLGDLGASFVTGVFGLPDDCKVKGRLYCAASTEPADHLECAKTTGDSAARVMVIDKDSIKANVPPNYFPPEEVNLDIKDFGQREQLRGFERRALSTDPAVFIITLPTGKSKKKAGFHAITDLSKWNEGGTLSEDAALRRFVGTWDALQGKYIPDDGFGINGKKYIHKVPGIEPIWGEDFDSLVGETICGVVKHAQVKGNPVHGKYLGLVGLKILSRSGSSVEVEVLDADDVCGLPLYIERSTVVESSGSCFVEPVAEVFAPAPSDGIVVPGEGTFEAARGYLTDCSSGVYCKGSIEVFLKDSVGQELCDQYGPPGSDFHDFIPIDRDPGGSGAYAGNAYFGTLEFPESGGLAYDTEICSQGAAGGSKYACEEFTDPIPIPTCPRIDLVFAIDLSGSMSGEVDVIKDEIDEIINVLVPPPASPYPHYRFGVVSYEDYPIEVETSRCGSLYYPVQYGGLPRGPNDEPFRIDQALTDVSDPGDFAAFVNMVRALQLGWGGDGPQSYGRVFWELGQTDTGEQLEWRDDGDTRYGARRLVVDFGDQVPHDFNVNEDISETLWDTGIDPGRNEDFDCNTDPPVIGGDDDIDFQDHALPALVAGNIPLLQVNSNSDYDVHWDFWTGLIEIPGIALLRNFN